MYYVWQKMAHKKGRDVHWRKHVISLYTYFSHTNTQTETTYKQWKNNIQHDWNKKMPNQIDRALGEFPESINIKLPETYYMLMYFILLIKFMENYKAIRYFGIVFQTSIKSNFS